MKACLSIIAALLLVSTAATAKIELDTKVSVDVGSPAVDVATSPDGKKIYVLTEKGKLVVMDANGTVEGSVAVGKGYSSVTPLRTGTKVILSGPAVQNIEIVALDLVHDIEVANSPTKGNPNAPVAVAVFTDFQ